MRNLQGYIDIHSHFLPGLDDGPEDYEKCLAAARQYVNIGVHCIVATPHCIHGTKWAAPPDRIFAAIRETAQRIDEAGIPLHILPGMEIAMADILCGLIPSSDFLSLADSGYYLVEFPIQNIFSTLDEGKIHRLLTLQEEKRFIIAHPERCAILRENIDMVARLVEKGVLIQININSILGRFGDEIRNTALLLFRHGLVHFLATDSHARGSLTPPTPEQMATLCRILGEKTVNTAFRENPLNLLSGNEIQPLNVKMPAVRAKKQYHPSRGKFVNGLRQWLRREM